MFKALGQLFNMFFVLFSGGEKLAKAFDDIAGIAQAEAAGLSAQMDIERGTRLSLLRHDAKLALAGSEEPKAPQSKAA
ncbi:MAG: hypothetical protein IPG06_18705 [Haliea sp.]|nr:hypothetical protein [Haliea sp.]